MGQFRILIVEDFSFFRAYLRGRVVMSFPGAAIDEAADAGEALQKVEAFLPDLILMDIQLPGENGLKLTKKIKATHPNIPILIVTGFNLPEYREAATQYGADGFIAKESFNRRELEELVRSHCDT
jgi:DNA-binding NarL/FixJ family response regulator